MDPVCGHSKIAPPPPSLQHFERDLEILKFLKILSIDHSKITLAPLSLQQLEGVLKFFGHSVFLYALSPPGITLSCLPQNWLLVANSEIDNSEYIHYSELPTPLIIVYLV